VLYWFLKTFIVGPFANSVFRPWTRGDENVPASGAVIFASNHLSFVDSVFLPVAVKRPISFLAKSEYFTGKGIAGWATKHFFLGINQLPIDRSGGKASEASLNSGLEHLAKGGQLGIYPEGTRSPDGRLYRGRTGVARMIFESVAIFFFIETAATEKVMPTGARFPKVRRVGVVFGEPLDFSRFAGMEGDRFVLRSITDEIMYELSRISGQEYVDVYASSVKKPSKSGVDRRAAAARAKAKAKAGAPAS